MQADTDNPPSSTLPNNAPDTLIDHTQPATPPSPLSPSLAAPGLLVAFELDAHSPYTVDSSDRILFDIAAEHITDDTHPIPFATIPLPDPRAAPFTLDQLRTALRASLQPAALVSMSTYGTLTPHQVIALQSSHFTFLLNHHPIATQDEHTTQLPPGLPVLLLRVADGVTEAAGSPQTGGSGVSTPLVGSAGGSGLVGSQSPLGRGSSMNPLQLPPSLMSSGDGIHGGSLADHAHPMGNTGSGISYSRASTLPMPHTRRASFDLSTHFDTLSLLDGGDRPQQQPQQHTTGMSEYHRHGLRPPRHNDHYVNEHSVRGSRADSNSGGDPTDPAADHVRGTPTATPSIRRTASSPPAKLYDSDDSDIEEEISPVDFPQPSAVRRRSSIPAAAAAAAAAAPFTPPSAESPAVASGNGKLSSSLPSSFGGLLGFLSRSTSTSPQAAEGTLPRRQSLSAERRAYYNSMDAAPSLAHRRMSEATAHQLTLTLKREGTQRELNRARTMVTPAMRARRISLADADEKRAEEPEEKPKEQLESKSGVSARAIRAIKRKLGVKGSGSKVRRQDTESKPHFADMMNEFSKSSANLIEPPDDQHYRIVVIGERGASDEREERKEEAGAGDNETSKQAKHRKNIVSDTTQLSTRVQPIHYLTAPAASAPSRFRTYDDVDTFLLTRPDEKRATQKSRVSTHHSSATDGDGGGKGREDVEPLWIAVEDAPASVIQKVGSHFGLHPLTIEDCESGGIREKLEVFNDYLFIVFHALDQVDEDGGAGGRGGEMYSAKHRRDSSASLQPMTMPHSLAPTSSSSAFSFSTKSLSSPLAALSVTSDGSPLASDPRAAGTSQPLLSTSDLDLSNSTPVKLVVFPSCVLTFHKRHLRCIAKVRRQLQKLYYNRLDNTAWVVHALLDTIVDSLIPVVGGACGAADALEDNIYMPTEYSASVKKRLLRDMNLMGRRLAFLRQRMWSKRDILMSLIEKDWAIFLRGVKIPYLRDVYDHVETMLHRIDTSIEVVDTIQSTYLSIVNIDVSVSAENVNRAMKKMSAAATIILPLTLVSAIMGMNTYIPWQGANNLADPSEYPPSGQQLVPFIVMMALFVLFSVGMYVYFKQIRYV